MLEGMLFHPFGRLRPFAVERPLRHNEMNGFSWIGYLDMTNMQAEGRGGQ
jgi:hypothetical protein